MLLTGLIIANIIVGQILKLAIYTQIERFGKANHSIDQEIVSNSLYTVHLFGELQQFLGRG